MYNVLFISLPVPEPMKTTYNSNFALIQYYFKAFLDANLINKNLYSLILLNEKDLGTLNNEGIINLIKKISPDIVLFSSYLWNIERNLHISKSIKEKINKKILTICGGPEIRKDNNFIIQKFYEGFNFDIYFDSDYLFDFVIFFNNLKFIISNEIEQKKLFSSPIFYSDLLKKYYLLNKNKNLSKFYNIENFLINKLFYHYSILKFNSKILYLEIERGCFQKCEFCQYAKNNYKQVSIKEETFFSNTTNILKNNLIKEIYFLAPTLNYNKNLFYSLLKYFIEINNKKSNKFNNKIKLFGEFNPFILKEEDIKLLAEANFREIEIGVQSLKFNENNNISNNKVENKVDKKYRLQNIFELLKKYKIKPIIDFIIGFPEDNFNQWGETCTYLENNKMLKFANFYHLLVLPGTKIKERFDKNGFLYLKEPPYYAIKTKNYKFDDIKRFYSFLEFDKNFSYYKHFEKSKKIKFIKFKIENHTDLDHFNKNFINNLSQIEQVSFSFFINLNLKTIEKTNFIREFFNGLKNIFIDKIECFIKIYIYIEPEILELKEKIDFLYQYILSFKKTILNYKNYFDKFHECINYNSDYLFSKNITILSNFNCIDYILEKFYLDFDVGLFIENFSNLENKLKKAKDLFKEFGFYSYVDNEFIKKEKNYKILKKYLQDTGIIYFL